MVFCHHVASASTTPRGEIIPKSSAQNTKSRAPVIFGTCTGGRGVLNFGGVTSDSSLLLPARRNISSVRNNSTVVDNYIKEELQEGRLVTIPNNSLASIQLSPYGVIPKLDQPNKWHLIIDLSSPKGNSGIDPALTSIQYSSIYDAILHINQLGTGKLMAKLDVKSAYRNIPVHPHGRPLLLCTMEGYYLPRYQTPLWSQICSKAIYCNCRHCPVDHLA